MNPDKPILFFLIVLLHINCSLLQALPGDSSKPIEIEADFAELDDEKGVTIYVGNVIVTQGSLRMTGEKLRIILDEAKDISRAIMSGDPATFKQRPQIDEEEVEGESKIIEYRATTDFLYLIDSAKLVQGERFAEGHRINYDINNKIITIRSSRAGIFQRDLIKKENSQRVKIIIPVEES
jgi:lipopolysaccharide export system protein LptA